VDAMLYLAGHIESVSAQSLRRVQDFGADDTTSMLFRFKGGASGYLGTVIATAETWRMQVFGSKGWAEVGGVEHLTSWDLRVCYLDPRNILVKQKPIVLKFEPTSTERAELEYFAQSAMAGRGIAMPGGDEVHNVAVLEAIVHSAREDSGQRIDA
jgi:predicted dehydrogenase